MGIQPHVCLSFLARDFLGSRGWFSSVFLKHRAWALLSGPPFPGGCSLRCSDRELQASLALGQAAEGQLGLIPLACEAKEQRPFAFLD